jgi:SAM-dependent methyltransferase
MKIQIPKQAIKYIKLQRTNIWINARKKFEKDIKFDFDTIKDFLPKKVKNILDIGCGLGMIDLLLYKYYGAVNLFLIDKTELNYKDLHYGYDEKGRFYNDNNINFEFLKSNGVKVNNIYFHEANNTIPFRVKFDLIISTLAWGFHFPVRVYLDEVYDKLRKDGVLIIDIRKGTEGFALLKCKFKSYEVIYEGKKFMRCLCRK